MMTKNNEKQRTVTHNLSGGDNKMRKILIIGIITIALITAIGLVSAGYGSGDGTCDGGCSGSGSEFVDEDGDGVCDNFIDKDGDGVNNNCDGTGNGMHKRYRNGGGTGYCSGNCQR